MLKEQAAYLSTYLPHLLNWWGNVLKFYSRSFLTLSRLSPGSYSDRRPNETHIVRIIKYTTQQNVKQRSTVVVFRHSNSNLILCFAGLSSLLFPPCSSLHVTDGSNRQVAGMTTTPEYVMSLWRPPPIPVDSFPPASWKRGCLPVRTSPPLTSAPSVSAKRAHGSCINQQHGDPRFSPDAAPPVIWLPEPCHYAGASSQSPLNKYETAPLCVTVFYIQQGSRESGGTFFRPSVS